ncbi:UNVERIFIED_CONTAM: Long-chain-alcohol O-fatty-acyltransferase [Sesamum radiatum]|uniref:Long-chain-alcohol O-fatty-acyltransferase n=1 Tax=Sesamum radiatum TaxID=300843 RepID=A0AAW2LRB8_SESRA
MVDPEIQAVTEIWLTAIVSLIFCHQIAARIPGGAARLLSVLPIIYLFTTLPLRLSSIHLGAPTIFYLVWLGNFKLLLFSFNHQALSPPLRRCPSTASYPSASSPSKPNRPQLPNPHRITNVQFFFCSNAAFWW